MGVSLGSLGFGVIFVRSGELDHGGSPGAFQYAPWMCQGAALRISSKVRQLHPINPYSSQLPCYVHVALRLDVWILVPTYPIMLNLLLGHSLLNTAPFSHCIIAVFVVVIVYTILIMSLLLLNPKPGSGQYIRSGSLSKSR